MASTLTVLGIEVSRSLEEKGVERTVSIESDATLITTSIVELKGRCMVVFAVHPSEDSPYNTGRLAST